jgi:hypothetical protein
MIGSTRELGLFSQWKTDFPNIERISEKNILRFVRSSMVAVAGTASRVKMNAKVRRP